MLTVADERYGERATSALARRLLFAGVFGSSRAGQGGSIQAGMPDHNRLDVAAGISTRRSNHVRNNP
jgi:hypothetical protein